MRIFLRLFLLFSLIFAPACADQVPEAEQGAIPDFVAWQPLDRRALWYSRISSKPVLLFFYHEDCTQCKRVSEEIFSKKDIVLMINNHFTPTRLNSKSAEGKQLMRELGIKNSPTVLILSYVDRSVLSKMAGVPTPAIFYSNLRASLQMDRVKSNGVTIGK